jgi:hypothetical protein
MSPGCLSYPLILHASGSICCASLFLGCAAWRSWETLAIRWSWSTLVQLVWTAAIDTTTQRVVFKKFFTFRGDNDEAWQRAERFVSEEVRDRLLESRSQQ